MTTHVIPTTDIRSSMTDTIGKIQLLNDSFILKKNSSHVAVIISLKDFALLQKLKAVGSPGKCDLGMKEAMKEGRLLQWLHKNCANEYGGLDDLHTDLAQELCTLVDAHIKANKKALIV